MPACICVFTSLFAASRSRPLAHCAPCALFRTFLTQLGVILAGAAQNGSDEARYYYAAVSSCAKRAPTVSRTSPVFLFCFVLLACTPVSHSQPLPPAWRWQQGSWEKGMISRCASIFLCASNSRAKNSSREIFSIPSGRAVGWHIRTDPKRDPKYCGLSFEHFHGWCGLSGTA